MAGPQSGPPRTEIRRAFTVPTRLNTSNEATTGHGSKSDADKIETLFASHEATIYLFTTPSSSTSSSKRRVSSGYDNVTTTELAGTLPWTSKTERKIISGPVQIYRVPGSVAFLNVGKSFLRHILAKSQCWCVDGETIFVLRKSEQDYYRIEFPCQNEEDKRIARSFSVALEQVLRFEKTPCPFQRGFHVELPENQEITLVPWKPKHQPISPITQDSQESPLGRAVTYTPRTSRSIRSSPSNESVTPAHDHDPHLAGKLGASAQDLASPSRSIRPTIGKYEVLDKDHERPSFPLDSNVAQTPPKHEIWRASSPGETIVSSLHLDRPRSRPRGNVTHSDTAEQVTQEVSHQPAPGTHVSTLPEVGEHQQAEHSSPSPLGSGNDPAMNSDAPSESSPLHEEMIVTCDENLNQQGSVPEISADHSSVQESTESSSKTTAKTDTILLSGESSKTTDEDAPDQVTEKVKPANLNLPSPIREEGTTSRQIITSPNHQDVSDIQRSVATFVQAVEGEKASSPEIELQSPSVDDTYSGTLPKQPVKTQEDEIHSSTDESVTIDNNSRDSNESQGSSDVAFQMHGTAAVSPLASVAASQLLAEPPINSQHSEMIEDSHIQGSTIQHSFQDRKIYIDDDHESGGHESGDRELGDSQESGSDSSTLAFNGGQPLGSFEAVERDEIGVSDTTLNIGVEIDSTGLKALDAETVLPSAPSEVTRLQVSSPSSSLASKRSQMQLRELSDRLSGAHTNAFPLGSYEHMGATIGEKMATVLLAPPLKLAAIMLRIAAHFSNGVRIRDESGQGWKRRTEAGRKLPGTWDYDSDFLSDTDTNPDYDSEDDGPYDTDDQ